MNMPVVDLVLAILQQPWWWVIWILWLILVNSASLAFTSTLEGKLVLACWLGNILLMSVLYDHSGYTRLLGLAHVLWWTPLLIFLYQRRESWMEEPRLGRWLEILMVSNGLSLLIDYVDVTRYLAGDRT